MNVIYHDQNYHIYQPHKQSESLEIERESETQIDQSLWLVIRYMSERKVRIKAGDVMRFGRVAFRIKETCF